jgi:Ca2+-binding EF-hand superfamily protein
MLRRNFAGLSALVFGCCAVAMTPPAAAQTKVAECAAMKALDQDNDGTMDLTEAQKAGSALFDRINPDKDGTLDKKELSGRLSNAQLQAADPDKDGTLDKTEFLKVVERRFKAADPDNDGTIDCKELTTVAGKSLLRVLRK